MTEKHKRLLMGLREALIVALRTLDEYLELPPTVPTRKQRRAGAIVTEVIPFHDGSPHSPSG